MKLLYVADGGFSYHNGKYYYTRPNHINSMQFGCYFDEICYIARRGDYIKGSIEINPLSKVYLIDKWDFIRLKMILKKHENEYDVALLRNGLNGCLVARQLKKMGKIVISYLGYDALRYQLSKKTPVAILKGLVWCLLEKKKMKYGDYAHYCAKQLCERYPSRVESLVCPNVEINCTENNITERRQKIFKNKSQIVVGMVATLNYNKGVDCAIKALTHLPKRYVLEIVGGGDATRYINFSKKNGVDERVNFLGYIGDRELLNKWMKNIDIYIQPSICEGLPRAAIEAMSNACPLIVSNTIGVSNWIDNEWQIAPRNHIELADKINKMASNMNYMLEQAEKNYECSKQFMPEERKRKMDAYYASLIR